MDAIETARAALTAAEQRHAELRGKADEAHRVAATAAAERQRVLDAAGAGQPISVADVKKADEVAADAVREADLTDAVADAARRAAHQATLPVRQAQAEALEADYCAAVQAQNEAGQAAAGALKAAREALALWQNASSVVSVAYHGAKTHNFVVMEEMGRNSAMAHAFSQGVDFRTHAPMGGADIGRLRVAIGFDVGGHWIDAAMRLPPAPKAAA